MKLSNLKIFSHWKNFFWDIAVFFSKNWGSKTWKFFVKIFLAGIDLEWSKTCFKTKISILKIFSRWKIFFWDIAVFSKNWWPKNRKCFENFFGSESIQNGPKRVLNLNYRFWKFFPLKTFFLGHSRFFEILVTKKSKIFRKFFFIGIDLEWLKTYFKTKISILKIFSRWKFFFWDIAIFSKNWWRKNR